ncbi:hypothetical protein KCMC57_up26460 [Kitasatospora sp. CMC57]|uniref:Transposase n=1 Tax=Kitasatospora sp. CMC57 TaxID=3231513 RepID=A0AB33JXU3_9ACTN
MRAIVQDDAEVRRLNLTLRVVKVEEPRVLGLDQPNRAESHNHSLKRVLYLPALQPGRIVQRREQSITDRRNRLRMPITKQFLPRFWQRKVEQRQDFEPQIAFSPSSERHIPTLCLPDLSATA